MTAAAAARALMKTRCKLIKSHLSHQPRAFILCSGCLFFDSLPVYHRGGGAYKSSNFTRKIYSTPRLFSPVHCLLDSHRRSNTSAPHKLNNQKMETKFTELSILQRQELWKIQRGRGFSTKRAKKFVTKSDPRSLKE